MGKKLDIRERLRLLLLVAGLSHQNIADAIELSQSTVGRILRKQADIHREPLEKWCTELGITVAELYDLPLSEQILKVQGHCGRK
ncbi:MAG: helix-turn-helix transcriptional regulator [Flavobacteriales bacterium]|nr:helix-turn-helix transcriptional regulator [Flavobacteriales bacterium]